jgi:hypothetical protein
LDTGPLGGAMILRSLGIPGEDSSRALWMTESCVQSMI